MTAQSHEQDAPLNSNITLRCRAENTNIQPEIRWYREGVPLPYNSRINGEYLYIYDVKYSDGGRYICEISSGLGSSTDYINLNVVGT